MFNNYFKTAFRFLKQNRIFTIINALGLSIALSVSFIILLYVVNELSYNHCHRNRKQVFRVLNYWNEFKKTDVGTPFVLAEALKVQFPQVQNAVNERSVDFKLKLKDDYLEVNHVISTESEIFDIFTIKITERQSDHGLLDEPNSIVLSQETADKFFPNQNPVGKEITGVVNNEEQIFRVTGVYEDIPGNSTFRAKCLVNSKWAVDDIKKTFGNNADKEWDKNFWTTWVRFQKNTDVKSLDNQFREFEKRNMGAAPGYQYSLQNLSDVYLKSNYLLNRGIHGNLANIRLFSFIALLIVIVAAANYILLSSAVSTGRAKEIGIRKTNGAENKYLRIQLLNESVLLTLFVLPIALVFTVTGLPYAGKLFQTDLHIIGSNILVYLTLYLMFTILIGIASGLYTSHFLSGLKVIDILNKNIYIGNRKQYIRSLLIVIQLVIFCSFISSTLIIRSQYKFALRKDPGYINKDIILIDLGWDSKGYAAYINSLKTNPDINMAAGSMCEIPTENMAIFMVPHFQDKNVKIEVQGFSVDYNFLKTMGIKVLEGRDFSEDYGNDLNGSAILNETAVKRLGIVDPIDKKINGKTIIGVVKDFNLHSIRSDIQPLFIALTDKYITQVVIQYRPGKLNNIVPFAKAEWEKVVPDRPFSYRTIEDITKEIYSSEKNFGTIILFSSVFALIIAGLGLFGLTLFVAKTRTKEVGIRKVLGSSEQSIIYSFLRKDIFLTMAAALISVPVTLYFMIKWLNNFAYKVNISWLIFVITFALAAFVVVITVFFHSFKASHANPVISLRYE